MRLIKADDKKIWDHAHYLKIKNEMKKLAAEEAKKKDKENLEIDEFKQKLVNMVLRGSVAPKEDIYKYDPDER